MWVPVYGQSADVLYAVHLSFDGSVLRQEGVELVTGKQPSTPVDANYGDTFSFRVFSFDDELLYASNITFANILMPRPPREGEVLSLPTGIEKSFRSILVPYFTDGALITFSQGNRIALTIDISSFAARRAIQEPTTVPRGNVLDGATPRDLPPSQFGSQRTDTLSDDALSEPVPAAPARPRRSLLWVFVGVVLLGVVGIGVYWWYRRKQ